MPGAVPGGGRTPAAMNRHSRAARATGIDVGQGEAWVVIEEATIAASWWEGQVGRASLL